MKISCIMANYNTPENYLRLSIESILNQTHKDLELIIVDDCSTDNSLEVLKEYSDQDKRILLIKNIANVGLARSLNIALKRVTSDYIARMDTDDISDPDRFEKQIAYLQKKNLELVGAETRRIDEEGNIVVPSTNKSRSSRYIQKVIKYENCIAHPSWLAKKEVYDKLLGYRDLHACEDYDFLLRANKNGFRLGICDSVLLSYRINLKGISQKNLLTQKASSWYLSSHINNIEKINQDVLNTEVVSKITQEDVLKFNEAMNEYNQFLNYMHIKKTRAFGSFLRSIKSSKYALKIYSCAFHVGICRALFDR